MNVKSVSCQIWWSGCDIARCRLCYDQTVSGTCKLGWHTFMPLTQTKSNFLHLFLFLAKTCGLQWTGDRGLSMSLFWFEICTGAPAPGAGDTLLPLTTGCCDETLCKQIQLRWSVAASHWSRACVWPSDWAIFPVGIPSLWSSLQFVAHAASALLETIWN